MSELIRVVVVDASPSACQRMISSLQTAPGLQVVGTALQGARAVDSVDTPGQIAWRLLLTQRQPGRDKPW